MPTQIQSWTLLVKVPDEATLVKVNDRASERVGQAVRRSFGRALDQAAFDDAVYDMRRFLAEVEETLCNEHALFRSELKLTLRLWENLDRSGEPTAVITS